MRRVFGPRIVVEAAFLVAVPIVALVAGVGAVGIVGASAVAYLVVLVIEAALARDRRPAALRAPGRRRRPGTVSVRPAGEWEGRSGEPTRPEEPAPEPAAGQEPEPAPPSEAAPGPEPEPAAPAARTSIRERLRPRRAQPESTPASPARAAPEHVRVLRPDTEPESGQPVPETELLAEPQPSPPAPEQSAAVTPEEPAPPAAPEPEPTPEPARPPLASVPELPPEPAAEPAEPAAQVVPIGVGAGPRQWNVWDLEHVARESAGEDLARDEERTFLLLYLREFADPSGMLPVDFDGLVRDSFGELVTSR